MEGLYLKQVQNGKNRSLSISSEMHKVKGMKLGRRNKFNMLNDNDNESRLSSKNSRYFVQLSPDKAPVTIREQDVSELKGDMETSFLRYQ